MSARTTYICRTAFDRPVEAEFAEWSEEPPRGIRWHVLTARAQKAAYMLAGLSVLGLLVASLNVFANKGLLFLILPLWWLGPLLRRLNRRVADPQVAELSDLPEPFPQIPVFLSLQARGHEYGRDQGLVSFNGPWLHFHGLQTTFNLGRAQVMPQLVPHWSRHSALYDLVVYYKLDDIPMAATFYASDQIAGGPRAAFAGLGIAGDHWIAGQPGEPGTSTFPPVVPQYKILSSARRTCFLMSVLILAPLLGLVASWWIERLPTSIAVCILVDMVAIWMLLASASRVRFLEWMTRAAGLRASQAGLSLEDRRVWPDSSTLTKA